MDEKLRRAYVPMIETGFYIPFSLQEERRGYRAIQYVRKITDNEIIISAGASYGILSKIEKNQLIRFIREEEKRKYYQIIELSSTVLQPEPARINRLYINSKGGCYRRSKENLQILLTCGIWRRTGVSGRNASKGLETEKLYGLQGVRL